METLFLEAGEFQERGGWAIDTGAISQMGAAYLMAHGAGIPVADARTIVNMPGAGHYQIWVRTRDWTAVWRRGAPAGRFKVLLDGCELPAVLGTNGAAWSWQRAGETVLAAGPHEVRLHDLTGFNGRCAALYFTTDAAEVPPVGLPELEAFRRTRRGDAVTDAPEPFDLVVVGGGIAGCTTALAADRLGLKALLLQDRPVLGGCNSSEVRVPLGGQTHVGPYPNLGNTVRELSPVFVTPGAKPEDWYEDTRKRNAFRREDGKEPLVHCLECVLKVEMADDDPTRIDAVIARQIATGKDTRYRARLFADCSGDGWVAVQAGARFRYGTESQAEFGESLGAPQASSEVMGLSVLWVSQVEAQPVPFPEVDWGIPFTESNCYYVTQGDWEAETGQYRNMAEETEYIRDYALMTTYANWSFLKNHSARRAEYANRRISWVSACGGKRESRRVVGDLMLTQKDIEEQVYHADGTAVITWSIDLHYPEPENRERFAEPFRSCAYHRGLPAFYPVPYRCLYARDVKNLFLGGRLVSLSHVAFSAARVMRTLGCLGEVVAMAAAICQTASCWPREVYEKYLTLLQDKMRVGIPVTDAFACPAVGRWEAYHFQGKGMFWFTPDAPAPRIAPEVLADVRKLNKQNLYFRPDAP